MKKFNLFCDDILVGSVILTDMDFPNLFGEFAISKDKISKRINDYIRYSVKLDEIVNEDEERLESFYEENEDNFEDLIEDVEWYMVDEDGKKHIILIPMFNTVGITWRWGT